MFALALLLIVVNSLTACSKPAESQANAAETTAAAVGDERSATSSTFETLSPTQAEIHNLNLDYKPFNQVSPTAAVISPSATGVPPVRFTVNGPGVFEITLEQAACASNVEIAGLTTDASATTILSNAAAKRYEFNLNEANHKEITVSMEKSAKNNWSCNVAIRKIG